MAQGWITIDYANPPVGGVHRLVRPLIVVEGFDPGNLITPENQFGQTNFNSFIALVNDFNSSVNLRNLLQSTTTQQYDIIYVDWARGTDFIQRNAMLLERVIRWVNEQKVIDGCTEPNVVLGQSMGGLVARWALKDMENRGLPHQTRLYISWDAPHLGANVPMAYQHAARHAKSAYLSVNGPVLVTGANALIASINNNARMIELYRQLFLFPTDPFNEIGNLPSNSLILTGLNLLDAPAARQMLISRVGLDGNTNNNLHNAWQTELTNMGFPTTTRNIAISNGSECAIGQGFAPGVDLFYLDGKANTRFLGDVIGMLALPTISGIAFIPQFALGIFPGRNDFAFFFNCKAQPSSGSGLIYKGKITYKKRILWLIPINTTLTDRERFADAAVLPIDGLQGGMLDIEINLQSQQMSNALAKYNTIGSSIPHFNFIPTASALNIGGGITPLTINQFNTSTRYIGATPPTTPFTTSFANFTTAFNQVAISNNEVNNNENHIQISARNGNWLAEELNGNTAIRTDCNGLCTNNAITGLDDLCTGTTTYNVPTSVGATYFWFVSNPLLATVSFTGASATLTRVGTASGTITLSAQITTPDCGTRIITKTIEVGTRAPNSYTICGYDPNQGCRYGFVLFKVNTTYPAGTTYRWYRDGILVATTSINQRTFTNWTCGEISQLTVAVQTPCGISQEVGETIEFICPSARISISPNPAKDNITVNFTPNEFSSKKIFSTNNTIIKIVDFYSKVVLRQWSFNSEVNSYNLKVGGLRRGIYTIQLEKDKKLYTEKLIIE